MSPRSSVRIAFVCVGLASFFVSCSGKVTKETAYKGRLKVETRLDTAAVATPSLEIRMVSSDGKLAPFQAEVTKHLARMVAERTQFKKVKIANPKDRTTASASKAPVLNVTFKEYNEPGFMNQYNGELVVELEFVQAGRVVAKATAIGMTKHDSTKVGVGAMSWKTGPKDEEPIPTASRRAVGFITAFLEGKDSQVEGSLF